MGSCLDTFCWPVNCLLFFSFLFFVNLHYHIKHIFIFSQHQTYKPYHSQEITENTHQLSINTDSLHEKPYGSVTDSIRDTKTHSLRYPSCTPQVFLTQEQKQKQFNHICCTVLCSVTRKSNRCLQARTYLKNTSSDMI